MPGTAALFGIVFDVLQVVVSVADFLAAVQVADEWHVEPILNASQINLSSDHDRAWLEKWSMYGRYGEGLWWCVAVGVVLSVVFLLQWVLVEVAIQEQGFAGASTWGCISVSFSSG
jgi:hypothetical protein